MCKLSVNSLIGLMAIDDSKLFKHNCSTSKDDVPIDATLISSITAGNNTIYDFVTITHLLGNTSHRPIHDLCLSTEAVRVGQMLYVLKASTAIPLELITDSVLFQQLNARP